MLLGPVPVEVTSSAQATPKPPRATSASSSAMLKRFMSSPPLVGTHDMLEEFPKIFFQADFCDGSYGYRPRRTAQAAVARGEKSIVYGKTSSSLGTASPRLSMTWEPF